MLTVIVIAGPAALTVIAHAQLRKNSVDGETASLKTARGLAAVVVIYVKAVEGVVEVLGGFPDRWPRGRGQATQTASMRTTAADGHRPLRRPRWAGVLRATRSSLGGTGVSAAGLRPPTPCKHPPHVKGTPMRLTRRLAAAAALTAALFAGILASAAPATALSPCAGYSPPDYCFAEPAPPSAPTGLKATAVLQTTVSLTWGLANTSNALTVTRTVSGVVSTFALAAGSTSFTDKSAPAGAKISYAIYASACNRFGCTDGAPATTQVTTHPVPASPVGFASGAAVCNTWYCPKTPPVYTMRGWAIDWDTTAPIQVALIEDGTRTLTTLTANAGFSSWSLTGNPAKGNHSVCAVALSVGGGWNTTLGCYTYYTPGAPSAATSLTATAYGTYATLAFTDTANDEDGYYLQRSTDTGASWLQVGSQYAALTGTGTRRTVTDYSSVPLGTCYRILMVNRYGQTPSAAACTS